MSTGGAVVQWEHSAGRGKGGAPLGAWLGAIFSIGLNTTPARSTFRLMKGPPVCNVIYTCICDCMDKRSYRRHATTERGEDQEVK